MSAEVFLFLPPPAAAADYGEAYPYGPDAAGFHADLGIKVAPAALPNSPALAVVGGMFRWIGDATSPQTGTLILTPHPRLTGALASVFGSPLVFVYRNVDFTSMIALFGPRIQAVGSDVFDADETGFLNTQYAVWVDAGERLGLPGPGAGGWGRLGFEVVYVPPLADNWGGTVRLAQLIDVSKTRTRRLDPVAFYAEVNQTGQSLALAQSHATHPLLALPTRRTLLELRDEYDEPAELDLDVLNASTGATTSYTFKAEQHGTVVLDTAPPGGAPPAVSYSISKTDYWFTALPSGGGAYQLHAAPLAPPAQWALQALYLPPAGSAAAEPDCWFVANTPVSTTPALPRYTAGNRVTPIRDGWDFFRRCADVMRTARDYDDFILTANWWYDDGLKPDGNDNGFYLKHEDDTSSLAGLTAAAASSGAQVRALLFEQLWDTETLVRQNEPQAGRLNAFPSGNARAILDGRTAFAGSHHQKFTVVRGKDGNGVPRPLAFCGGIDFNANRRDTPGHRAFGGYHDVHAEVEGPAVLDLFQSFKDRWDFHAQFGQPALAVTLDPADVKPSGPTFVQVARTYPQTAGYPFAPLGSFTPLQALHRAIKRAKKFIYIEDQYLTPYSLPSPAGLGDLLGLVAALQDALRRIDYLVVVIPNYTEMAWLKRLLMYWETLNFPLLPPALQAAIQMAGGAGSIPGQARFRRKLFIRELKSDPATRDKVHVFYLGRSQHGYYDEEMSEALGFATEGDTPISSGGRSRPDEIYCHSKVWIVDDVVAKIGSANCNKRSYTNDSEMDLIMLDGAVDGGARALARRLRMGLWAEHLGLGKGRAELLRDHLQALQFWLGAQTPTSHVRPYDEESDAPDDPLFTLGWDTIVDPVGI